MARVRGSHRILVTGASGFVGRQTLAPLVSRGYDVHAVKRGTANPDVPGVVWHHTDLFDPLMTTALISELRPTHLLHLAWCTMPGVYWTSSENLEWVRASIALTRAFSDGGGQRLVVAGTSAEYDWRPGYCVEHLTPLVPTTVYGTAKHALRLLLEQHAAQAGVGCAWARLFFLYGPHERPGRLVPSVIQGLLNARPVPCTDGAQLRDFLHVGDAGDALAALTDSPVCGPINIASGLPTTVRRVVEQIAARIGRPELVQFGALVSPEAPCVIASTERLRTDLGWTPRFALEEGLANTIEWWLHSGQVQG
jgi:nucleoside-diphosphate-sugar epimerase